MRVQLVVTCAKEKRLTVPAELRLAAVPVRLPAVRAADWVRLLAVSITDTIPAADLYAGTHWAAARETAAFADHAWVASAGYGLIPFDAQVRPYSATFALGDPDSVVPPKSKSKPTDPADWWDALADWPGPVPGSPRRLTELADPGGFLLVAASVPYLRAMGRDLAAANEKAPGRVAVICGGARSNHPLADILLPCDARLQPVVGGPLVALNARVARKLLAEPPATWTLTAARDRLAGWLAAAPKRTRVVRRGVDDEEVLGYIRRELTATPAASATTLLRELRGRGLACEQKRFARLFRTAQEA